MGYSIRLATAQAVFGSQWQAFVTYDTPLLAWAASLGLEVAGPGNDDL